MSQIAKEEFTAAFGKVVTKAWTDEAYAARLESAPRDALAEAGLEAPAGATITINRDAVDDASLTPEQKLDNQFDLWNSTTELHIPRQPQVDTSELSEDDLANVAGGFACCCCPCCCWS